MVFSLAFIACFIIARKKMFNLENAVSIVFLFLFKMYSKSSFSLIKMGSYSLFKTLVECILKRFC